MGECETGHENWMTIEQAAVALGLSVRTVTRHVSAGKLPSRLIDGRREVSIENASRQTSAQGPAGALNIPAAQRDDGSAEFGVDYETVLALADNAADKAELAVSAYQTLARSADERIHGARRLSYVAWALVAVMSVGATVAVGWTTHKLTRAAVETENLQQQIARASGAADTATGECDDLRRALAAAREDAARAEGKLAAYSETAAAYQTPAATRPSLADRIASIFDE